MVPERLRLHHVGHVVRDLGAALELHRRLGFAVHPPVYPAMAPREGAEPEPFGAVNTHADFARDFLELATVADGAALPPDARIVPLQAPPEVLPTLLAQISETTSGLAGFLDRFEGLHILMFSSADIEATADRLTRSRVAHGGVHTVRRPVGDAVETVRFLEIENAEGRIGVAADLDEAIQATRVPAHPNGAVGLVDATLCTADAELDAVQARYERYLGRVPRCSGAARIFDLDGATLTLVPAADLANRLPGAEAPALPAVVACTVAVRNLTDVRDLLWDNGMSACETPSNELFVPAASLVFRQA
ncbi:VOC family protein [Amycolatopsis sp. 195334CR]|uniref:VOC family protein n=1 Tax=Amycolatopsis sp. 195334CR TaxID=2814588 RepID=UPI001A8E46FD|nr:VOC family protein [Amycolatopsis sp. 195334CR]MBN6038183.1 VOC family protein [Amycolatopsis sp. 195334CR]